MMLDRSASNKFSSGRITSVCESALEVTSSEVIIYVTPSEELFQRY